MDTGNKELLNIIRQQGLITNKDLDMIVKIDNKEGKKLEDLLVDRQIITKKQLTNAMGIQLGIPFVDLNNYQIDPDIPIIIDKGLAERHLLIPINIENGELLVAMVDPLDLIAMDDVSLSTGYHIKTVIATKDDILNSIDRYFDNREIAEQAIKEITIHQSYKGIKKSDPNNSLETINQAPVVQLVNMIIERAVRERASDIHIEPFKNCVRIRYRIDGDLKEVMKPSKHTHSSIVTRIKIMTSMDIAENRNPQDGRVELFINEKPIDMRVSILPTIYGEKIVIRLLDKSNIITDIISLGFRGKNLDFFNKILRIPSGMVLVTGPTGSGKTTTLYALLRELNQINRNIITIEDPIEYSLEGINQVQINRKAGLSFATGLRSILRQDPDIIMVGEIRDVDTAQIAIRAAITGHIVLSTLHTNDTASSISRLVDMGIDNYLLSSAIVAIISQRLLKRICINCKYEYKPSIDEIKALKIDKKELLYRGKGCNLCNNTGYLGRIAIHEIMLCNKKIRSLINNKASIDCIKEKAIKSGMVTLYESGKELVVNGITTIEELLRICYYSDI